uniref:Uncharacterized protein n=1 Tax=Trichogramma kaykai TaxID=54128 RepID=A0ABD2WLT4_9HYME
MARSLRSVREGNALHTAQRDFSRLRRQMSLKLHCNSWQQQQQQQCLHITGRGGARRSLAPRRACESCLSIQRSTSVYRKRYSPSSGEGWFQLYFLPSQPGPGEAVQECRLLPLPRQLRATTRGSTDSTTLKKQACTKFKNFGDKN